MFYYVYIFSLKRADSVSKSQYPDVVYECAFVCAIAENPLPGEMETSGIRANH